MSRAWRSLAVRKRAANSALVSRSFSSCGCTDSAVSSGPGAEGSGATGRVAGGAGCKLACADKGGSTTVDSAKRCARPLAAPEAGAEGKAGATGTAAKRCEGTVAGMKTWSGSVLATSPFLSRKRIAPRPTPAAKPHVAPRSCQHHAGTSAHEPTPTTLLECQRLLFRPYAPGARGSKELRLGSSDIRSVRPQFFPRCEDSIILFGCSDSPPRMS
jgi:hypothetical protein